MNVWPVVARQCVTGVPDQQRFKNKLQEYTQKAPTQLPVYQTVNEGTQHAPQFRCTVLVDGTYYKSPNTFPQRKGAEQDAARVALDDINQKIKDDGRPLICEVSSLMVSPTVLIAVCISCIFIKLMFYVNVCVGNILCKYKFSSFASGSFVCYDWII